MIYLDHGATSFPKPESVRRAMQDAMDRCGNPGRGGYKMAMNAAKVVFDCREKAAELFECQPEQVVFTSNCTQGLNMAIATLFKAGDRVAISGFEHNAVTRPLHGMGCQVKVAGRKLFDWKNTLEEFEQVLNSGVDGAVFTHVSNVFGYILPVAEMTKMCRQKGIPFIVDAAQSAGKMPVSLRELEADFIAMPGHKGLLGPMGTGLLLCNRLPKPLMMGGTGSESKNQKMPDFLPDRGEAGTVNVPGIAGLCAGILYLQRYGVDNVGKKEADCAVQCVEGLKKLGFSVYSGEHQGGTVSFLPGMDCEEAATILARAGIAVRAGLHCAPLAHESAGTLETGTVRISFGGDCSQGQVRAFLQAVSKLRPAEF